MPRRKRKSIDARKGPLQFQESPFSGMFHPPSPVFCSDNPATAEVVPINEDRPIPWVSPQFSRAPTSLTKAKKTRRSKRLANKTVDVNSTTLVTPNHRTRKKIHCKLVPLRFYGDKTPEPPSIIEDVSYDENTPPVEIRLDSPQKGKIGTNIKEKPDECKQCVNYDDQCRIKCCNLETSNHHDSISGHVPVTKTKTGKKVVKKKTKSTRLKINLDDLFSDDSDISLLAAHGKKEEYTSKNTSVSHSANIHSVLNRTPLKSIPSPHTPKSSHKLQHELSVTLSNAPDHKVSPYCNTGDIALDGLPSNTNDQESLSSLRLNLSTPTSSAASDKQKFQPNDKIYGSFLTPDRKRRSLRLMQMFLPATPTQAPLVKEKYSILAYDTPEEDYGLPLRKRYLKGIKPLKIKQLNQL